MQNSDKLGFWHCFSGLLQKLHDSIFSSQNFQYKYTNIADFSKAISAYNLRFRLEKCTPNFGEEQFI